MLLAVSIACILLDLSVVVVYFIYPVVLYDSVSSSSAGLVLPLAKDLVEFFLFQQSPMDVGLFALLRLALFSFVLYQNRDFPTSRGVVYLVFLLEAAMAAIFTCQLYVFSFRKNSFSRYRNLLKHSFLYIVTVSVGSCALQIICVLRLNEGRVELDDDKLLERMLSKTKSSADLKKDFWRKKWSKVTKQFKKQSDPIFEAVLRLYAHKQGAVERLAKVYDSNPEGFEFYLPQMCSFLLLGGFLQSPQLCIILLEKCELSHVFAHRMRWYLSSFCVDNESFLSEEKNRRIKMLIDEVSDRGLDPSIRLFQEESHGDLTEIGTEDEKAEKSSKNEDEFSSNEPLLNDRSEEDYQTFHEDGELAPLQETEELEHGSFDIAVTFLKELSDLSSYLRYIPMSERNAKLADLLAKIDARYLPSKNLFLPVGNAYHRIKRIHVAESFTFSTRERVPYLLCAEVVDIYKPKKKTTPPFVMKIGNREFNLSKLTLLSTTEDTSAERHKNTTVSLPSSPDFESSKLGFWSETTTAVNGGATDLTLQPKELLSGLLDSFSATVTRATRANTLDNKTKMKDAQRKDSESAITLLTTMEEGCIDNPPKSLRCTIGDFRGSDITVDKDFLKEEDRSTKRNELTPSPMTIEESIDVSLYPSDHSLPNSPESGCSVASPTYSLERSDSTDFVLETLCNEDAIYENNALNNSAMDKASAATGKPKNQPPCVVFKERWKDKEERIKSTSQWGKLPGWRLLPVIVKSNDDLRQEQFASQLIRQFHTVFKEAKLPVYVRSYDVIATSPTCGFVEAIPDTISLDSLKRNDQEYTTLLDFFIRHFGDSSSSGFRKARANFVSSMAAYSIICYLLQIKDRHNGNLLLDEEGHIIHIDFGFILSNNPGNVHFESAPFKLTAEFVELMGGPRSASFRRFRSLCVRSFLVARKFRHRFTLLVEMMLIGNEHLPCFQGDPRGTVDRLTSRFRPDFNSNACEDFVHELIDTSLDNWRTRWYDKYQRWCVGVF